MRYGSCFILKIFWKKNFLYSIIIINNISIRKNRNIKMLLESIDTSKISTTLECLFVRTSMNRDEICPSILESLAEFNQESIIFPTKSSLYRNRDFYRICHFFNNSEGGFPINHERRAMSTFYHLLGRATHIDIDTRYSIGFDDFCCLSEHVRIFSEYLYHKRILTRIMRKCLFLELF